MKRMFKRILSVLLVAVMLIGIAPIGGINLLVESTAIDLSLFSESDIPVFSLSIVSETDSEVVLSFNLERGCFGSLDLKIDSYANFANVSNIEKSQIFENFLIAHNDDGIGAIYGVKKNEGTVGFASIVEYDLKGSMFVFTFKKRIHYNASQSDFVIEMKCSNSNSGTLIPELINYLPELEEYTVLFEANGGNVNIVSDIVSDRDSIILPTPTKDFTITYNANNGVGAPSEQDVSVACKGWSTSSSATSATYACGESFKPIADTTLYAVWNNTVNTMLYSTEPTKEGFVFQGWSTNKNATSATYSAGANISLSSDITLYAIWSKTDNTNPTGSISSTNNVASSQMVTLSLYDNVGVAGYYWGTSSTYTNNTYTSTNSSSVTKTISSSGTYYLTVKDTSGNVSSNYSITFYKTTLNANGGSVSPTSVLTKSGNSFTFPTPTRSGYTYSGWATSNSATSGVSSLTPNSNKTYYAVWYKLENIYNLGDETYSFENFGDDDSYGGHCFGMSITSSGYYTNNLDRKIIGGDTNKSLFSYSKTETVKAPICYYQNIQGSYSRYATVAGGCYYLNGYYDMDSDWKSVVNYVKNHSYDNKGSLQVGYRKNSQGGHAINFLYYKEVNGEQRIYVYDNNFPNTETYLYKSEDGRVYQAPYSTFSGSIDCIALRDVSKYYDIAGDFDASRCIYAETGAIDIKGDVLKTPMEGLINGIEYTMYELQDNVDMVTVIPLKDNATFSYLNVDYSFDVVKDDTYGLLELLDSEHGALGEKAKFTIIDENFKKVKSVSVSDVSLNYKASTTIKSNITADEGAEYTVTYTSSNPSVARVDENGKVYGAKRGSTEITVTVTDEYGNTASDTCKVNVTYAWWQWIIIIVLFGWIWY